MKIAIVHEFLTKIGGAEKVLLILHQMFPNAPIFTLVYDEKGTRQKFKECKIVTSSLQKYPRFIRRKTKLFLPKLSNAIEEFNLSEYDVVISSSNSFAHGILTKPKTFHLCYCHSPMRYAWDWYHEYMKENQIGFGPIGLYIRSLLHKIRIWDKVASSRVDFWIANSNNVKKRIKKYYGFNSIVIYPPVSVSEIKMSDNIPDDYYVIVSRLEPYKKIELAIKAFNKLKKELVIIGVGSHEKHLKSISNDNIEFLGWQSNQSIYEYLRNTKALVFPGEDDFGIVPIEAMACGRPVIAYNKGGALETIREGITGSYFSDENSSSLCEAVDKLENNYTDFSPVECRKQAEIFSTEKFKKQFLKTLEKEYDKYLKNISYHE